MPVATPRRSQRRRAPRDGVGGHGSGWRVRVAAAALCAGVAAPASAADHGHEVVPELNAFVKLSDRTRVYLLGDVTVSSPDGHTEGELGAHLDYTLTPIFRPALREADWARDRYLWARVGLVVLGSPDGGRFGPTERRGIAELTLRAALPQEIWLVNRARVDLRDLDGTFSQRYRLRIGIEREFAVEGVVLVPYAQAEAFYDTRYDTWNRQLYQAGVEVELSKTWRIEPYVARQNDSRSASANVDRFGLVLKVYR